VAAASAEIFAHPCTSADFVEFLVFELRFCRILGPFERLLVLLLTHSNLFRTGDDGRAYGEHFALARPAPTARGALNLTMMNRAEKSVAVIHPVGRAASALRLREAGLLRRRERGGILLVGVEPLVFEFDATYVGGIRAFRVRGEPVLR
jgi:hypothetical protein